MMYYICRSWNGAGMNKRDYNHKPFVHVVYSVVLCVRISLKRYTELRRESAEIHRVKKSNNNK